MFRASLTPLCLVALLTFTGFARADEPNLPAGVNVPAMTLQMDANADSDTTLTHFFRRNYGYYGGYGGYYGGYYSRPYYGYSYSYYPSYSYYRPYYNYSYYPSYSYGYGYGYSYRPYYGGYYYGGYCGISSDKDNLGTASNLGDLPQVPMVSAPVAPTQPNGNFNYNGNPDVVPQPNTTQPQTVPQPKAEPQGLLVSYPAQQPATSFAFPAYGETTQPAPATNSQGNFAFPAYGEQQGGSDFGTSR